MPAARSGTRQWFVIQWWDTLTMRLSRRSGLAIAVAAVAMIVALLAFVNRDLDQEPTSTTSPALWSIRPTAGGPTISFEFDEDTGWTRMTDSRAAGKELFFHEGRVLFAANLEPLGLPQASFLSVPIDAVFPSGMTFDPKDFAPSLDRGPKECTFPSPVEDLYVQFFLSSAIPELGTRYTICGRNAFSNGSGVDWVHSEDLSSRQLSPPTPTQVAEVEALGPIGQVLLGQLKAEFEDRRG
jgi:hypothetical protein